MNKRIKTGSDFIKDGNSDVSLKCTKNMVFEVDYYELDRFINNYYGTDNKYEMIADNELMNDISKKFIVRKENIDPYYQKKIRYFQRNWQRLPSHSYYFNRFMQ